jgi:hypothetical protein
LAGWTALVLASVAGLAYWYLSAQRMRLEEETHRELAQASRDIRSNLTELSSNAAKYFTNPENTADRLIVEFARRNPYVDLHKTTLKGEAQKAADVKTDDAQGPDAGVCTSLMTPQKLSVTRKSHHGIEIVIDAQKIFDDVAISNTFEYLFIADAKSGEVTFATEHGEASRHRHGLGWIDSHTRQNASSDHPVISLLGLGGLARPDGQRLDPKELFQASASQSVSLGTSNFLMFSYPIEIQGGGTCGSAETWIVGGLVDPNGMWTEAATLSPRRTLVVLLILLLVFTAKPLVKLLLLQPGERFHFTDACILLPSAAVLLMLTTILLLAWGSHSKTDAMAKRGLRELSLGLEERLMTEFSAARTQLTAYDGELQGKVDNHNCLAGSFGPNDIPNLFSSSSKLVKAPTVYPDLSLVMWLDQKGNQILKADVHSQLTPRQNLEERPYFTESRSARWNFQFAYGVPFFVQSLRNNTTGELTTALSIQSAVAKDCIAAITMAPLSVERPILPAGYSFAVIAADGQVLYHSDPRRTLKEDFLAEIGDPESLHAAIQALRPGDALPVILTTYGRSPVGLHIQKLGCWQGPSAVNSRPARVDCRQGMAPTDAYNQRLDSARAPDWFLITLRDRRWLEDASTEALVHATTWSLLAWFPVLLCVMLAVSFQGKKILAAMWPNPQKVERYRSLAWICGILLVAGLTLVSRWPQPGSAGLFRLAIVYPLLTIALTIAALNTQSGWLPGFVSKWPSVRWADAYTLAVAVLWMTVAVVPAVGLFRHSWHRELDKLDQYERAREQRRRADWAAQDAELYKRQNIDLKEIDIKDQEKGGFLGRRSQDRICYRVAYSGPSSYGLTPSGWDNSLDYLLPFYDEPVESLRYQVPETRDSQNDDDSAWVSPQYAQVTLNDWSASAFVATYLLALWLLRLNIRRLFWTSLELGSETASETKTPVRFALLLVPSAAEKQMLREIFQRPKAASVAAVAESNSGSAPTRDDIEVIDFEESFQEEEARQDALDRLERAEQEPNRWVVVLAVSDPLRMLNGGELAASIPDTERQRWISALNRLAGGASALWSQSVRRDGRSVAPPFDAVWRQCSQKEQLALIHVAQEGFANPSNSDAVKNLLAKGLLKFAPNLVLLNGDFENFVQARANSPEIKEWERPEGVIGWHGARWIFVALLVIGLLFAAGTGQAWLKGATTMMTMLAGGLEAMWRILNAVQRPRSLVTP